MVDHATFSGLRLSRLYPAADLEAYPWYVAVKPQGNFETEYLGGQWHEEVIDGVQLYFPACAGGELGAAELWGSGCVASGPARDRPASGCASLVPSWTANAERVLAALDLPVRLGSPEADVRALAAGRVHRSPYPDAWYAHVPGVERGTVSTLRFASRAPDVYHLSAVLHATEGLLRLTVLRPDLVRRNGATNVYDACFGALHDEGPGAG